MRHLLLALALVAAAGCRSVPDAPVSLDVSPGRELARLRGESEAASAPILALALDGPRPLVASEAELALWDVGTGELVRRLRTGLEQEGLAVLPLAALSSDGRRALSALR